MRTMGSRAGRRFLPRLTPPPLPLWPPLRAVGIFTLMAMETDAHHAQEQFSVRTDFGANVRFCLILNHQATLITIWMRVKGWTGCGKWDSFRVGRDSARTATAGIVKGQRIA